MLLQHLEGRGGAAGWTFSSDKLSAYMAALVRQLALAWGSEYGRDPLVTAEDDAPGSACCRAFTCQPPTVCHAMVG
jgi:hypothetical protein